jgi:hypothetical protein
MAGRSQGGQVAGIAFEIPENRSDQSVRLAGGSGLELPQEFGILESLAMRLESQT